MLLVSYGSTARSVYLAALELKRKGIKAGFLRLKTLWPLHEEKIRNSCKAKKIIIIENNMEKKILI
ncbi:MAG: transketolase C-terminal domain-containing protein [Desulfurococcaceae archaeon]